LKFPNWDFKFGDIRSQIVTASGCNKRASLNSCGEGAWEGKNQNLWAKSNILNRLY